MYKKFKFQTSIYTLTLPKIIPRTRSHPTKSRILESILKKCLETCVVQNLPIGRPNKEEGTNLKKITPKLNIIKTNWNVKLKFQVLI